MAPLAVKWLDWKEDQANEAEPMQKDDDLESSQSVKDDSGGNDQKEEEDGAA